MKVKLISLDSWTSRRKIVASKLPITIGRGREADVRLEDRWTSRCHCQVDAIDGAVVARDLDSRHGTLVNGHAITEGHLMPGDTLTIGMSSFRVEYRCSRKRPPAPSKVAG